MNTRAAAFSIGFTMLVPGAADAAAVSPGMILAARTDAALVDAQHDDLPFVVRLLVQRAMRAERRGDFATADDLYEAIRGLGYAVQQPPRGGRPAAQGAAATASGTLADDEDDGEGDDGEGDDDGGDDGGGDDGGGDDGGGDDGGDD